MEKAKKILYRLLYSAFILTFIWLLFKAQLLFYKFENGAITVGVHIHKRPEAKTFTPPKTEEELIEEARRSGILE